MSPQEARRLVGHSNHGRGSIAAGGKQPAFRMEPHNCTPAARDDIVELGRRLQKAWNSHLPTNEYPAMNAVGHSFGQLTDEIERLRTALRAVRACTDQSWANQIIRDALREGDGT